MTKTTLAAELAACPFCGERLAMRGGVNPYGRCDTQGCWMHARKIMVPLLDPQQVAEWNRRATNPAPADGLVEARFGDGYAATALADLTNEITLNVGPDAPDVPNFADWQITLPAGHWRAIAEFVRSCSKPATTNPAAPADGLREALKAARVYIATDYGCGVIQGQDTAISLLDVIDAALSPTDTGDVPARGTAARYALDAEID